MVYTRKIKDFIPRNEIIAFLNKEFKMKSRLRKTRKVGHSKIPFAMLSAKSKTVLSGLYKEILAKNKIVSYRIETVDPPTHTHQHIPKEIRQCIDGYPTMARKSVLKIGHRTVVVHCVIPLCPENRIFENPLKVDEFFGDCLYKIDLWLSLAFSYAPAHCSNTIQVHLYMTAEKKTLPNISQSAIDAVHANTAFTTSCAPRTEINVFRREEWFKVFIHETFHCLGLDFSEMDSAKANAHICSLFLVKSDVRLYETFCEMWAEIIHDMFYLYLERRVSLKAMPEVLIECIAYEKMYSVFQCVKVLRHWGLTYRDLFEESVATREKYKENTQVLSYYILKSVAMVFMNDFVEWCADHNPRVLFFEKTEKNVDAYCKFFTSHCKLPKYLELVENAERVLQKGSMSTFLKNTMCMSVYG